MEETRDGVIYRRSFYRAERSYLYFSDELRSQFHRKFNHSVRTRKFPNQRDLALFASDNPHVKIFLTLSETDAPFRINGNDYYVNIDSYIEFCSTIASSTKGRARAFLGQHIDHAVALSDKQRVEVLGSATLGEIEDMLRELSPQDLKRITDAFRDDPQEVIKDDERVLSQALDRRSPSTRRVVLAAVPMLQLETLKEHRRFLGSNLDKSETFIQNWVDAKINDDGSTLECGKDQRESLKRSRCLIFGLEYKDHKREGEVSSKKFDVLTKMSDGRDEYVLLELKSPNSKVFEVSKRANRNGGTVEDYELSRDVARAIPQILNYRQNLKDATDQEWQAIGLSRGDVVKCIILVGTRDSSGNEQQKVWDANYYNLKKGLSSSIEIMTYTDLLDKLDATIHNLEKNL